MPVEPKDVTRRFAKQGYMAIAPELYARQGDVSKLKDIQDIMSIVAKVPDSQVLADLDATAAWARGTGKGDGSRLDITGDLKAPVLGLYAGKDRGIPQTDVEKMRAALEKAGAASKIIVYPNAQHGFNADYRPSYSPQDAKDGWTRLLAWFAERGVR